LGVCLAPVAALFSCVAAVLELRQTGEGSGVRAEERW